jgi:hypothetical protein
MAYALEPKTPNWSERFVMRPVRLDKGLFGGPVGKGRMYFDIVLPAITPNLLIDVGMSMSRVHGVVGMAPRWFAMFSPTACPYNELHAAPKSNSSIMLTWRIYF